MPQLALDHLTLVDATPEQLAEAAADVGCTGLCIFLQSMPVLPAMPQFNLVDDAAARRRFKQRMTALGLTLDLAYPFTLSARSTLADFTPALAAAAELDTQLLNVLIYDRDASRRHDHFAQFCDLAARYGLRVGLEFYPASQVRSLADGLDLVCAIGRPGDVGLTVDLLHLMRSGGSLAELRQAPKDYILFGQFADGPATRPKAEWEEEASSDRLLAGTGAFDLAGFAQALPAHCPVSVEIPRTPALAAGQSHAVRARQAVEAIRALRLNMP